MACAICHAGEHTLACPTRWYATTTQEDHMTTEETYERLVARLEARYAGAIAAEARAAFVETRGTTEERHQAAHDAVFDALTGDDAWTDVEAADISDIAYEAATDAEREAVSS